MTTSWVISIDFGTAYSCYGYSQRKSASEPRCPPSKIPTCILFDKGGKYLHFGDKALNEIEASGQNGKYFFNDFKMLLYNRKFERNMMISDSEEKPMEAMKVFSESINYLKNEALGKIFEHIPLKKGASKESASEASAKKIIAMEAIAKDTTWVLTVPTIWDPAAKQFMREAAIQGGLVTEEDSSRLIIALEPEAASLFCKQLTSQGFISKGEDHNTLESEIGTQYIVVDCGGGTVDMTVHEVRPNKRLHELHKAQGNDMGGAAVDAEFKKFLQNSFGDVIWDRYEKNKAYPGEMLGMMYDFKKLKCNPAEEGFWIRCPHHMSKLGEPGNDIGRFFKDVQGASWANSKIHISLSKLQDFFKKSVGKIVDAIRAIVHYKGLKIRYIILVGGYSSSKILRDEVERQFSSETCTILFPVDAQLAVTKGAVLYGLDPMIVASRVCAWTYGTDIARRFDKELHRGRKTIVNKAGHVYCDKIFKKFVENGQSVDCDHILEYKFEPIDSNQTAMGFQFFRTAERNAKYVDETGMERIGQFTVKMPDIRGGLERQVTFEICFGLTEIQASAIDQTSKERNSLSLKYY